MYPGHHARTTPDKAAQIMASTGEVTTYRELDEAANRLAQLLYDRGLREGDHISILAENHPRYYEAFWAAMISGLYFTTINRYLSPEEAAYLVNDSGSNVLITTNAMANTAVQMLDLIPDCQHRLMMDGNADGFESYEDAVADMPSEPLPRLPKGAVMLYSSGTTGKPKGILRPLPGVEVHDDSLSGISMLERHLLGMSEDSVYLSPAPLYHSAPLMWNAGLHELGGTLVLMDRFDPERFLAYVEQYSVSDSQLVPTMFIRMLKLPEEVRNRYDLSSLKMAVHAAAPCPVAVKEQMIEWWGPIIQEYYAATEGSGLCFIGSDDWLAHKGSVGKAMVGTLHICDDDGRELPTGEPGLVYFDQETPPFEYHGAPEKTRDSRHPENSSWTTVGDIGYVDEEGYLYLTDRATFMIISGGVNIYPQEIEACFALHPKVADVAVFGLPDEEMGEYVHAVVQLEDGVEGTDELAEELRSYARQQLAGFKVPRVVDFRADFPRLPTGKLYKKPLREEYLARLS
ncbi:MAG: acyl-CoA synthetase [Acidimicrobiia bacterium]|nr:acyl-CoA synthetase [Acidimicrobiia bacterium]MYG58811.1 acyl-CoA synthetase [Acidimicrobiia bacterium]MYJ33535.1 acyl-CoA synthetase [Acidimicrobiia bacterium]